MIGDGCVNRRTALLGEHDQQAAAVDCRVRATRAGRPPLDNLTLQLARVSDGQVTELTFHNRDDAPVDAFWS